MLPKRCRRRKNVTIKWMLKLHACCCLMYGVHAANDQVTNMLLSLGTHFEESVLFCTRQAILDYSNVKQCTRKVVTAWLFFLSLRHHKIKAQVTDLKLQCRTHYWPNKK